MREFGAWFLVMAALVAAAAHTIAADGEHQVTPKGKPVEKQGSIDHNDEEESAAHLITNQGNKVTLLSKVFTPPTDRSFVEFPGTGTHVDVTDNPDGLEIQRPKDGAQAIQVQSTFIAATAGNFPYSAEGNISAKKGAGGKGKAEVEHWSAKIMNQKFDLIVHNAFAGDGTTDGPAIPESKEEIPGAFGVANKNNTDSDTAGDEPRVDKDETGADAANCIVGEKDMIKVIIKKVTDTNIAGSVALEMTGDGTKIKLWKKETKEGGPEAAREWAIADLPKTLWIEGLDHSAHVRDIDVVLKKKDAGGGFADGAELDKAKLTFVWATRTGAEFGRKTAAELMASDEWKTMTSPPMDWFVDQPLWLDGTGLVPKNHLGSMRNAMVMKFKIHPDDVWKEPGVKVDISRQAVGKLWTRRAGDWQIEGRERTDPNDDETPNDDAEVNDESESPNHAGEIFVADPPGYPETPTDPTIIDIALRSNFREFVRVSFNGVKPSENKIDGSRCSDRFVWHARVSWTNVNGWVRGEGKNQNEIEDGPPEIAIGENP